MIINIPIEPIPLRYSTDWQNWFTEELYPVISIYGKSISKGIEKGKFLDIMGTNYYKSSQLMEIIQMIQSGQIDSGDILFFHDLWFPGIEQLAYIRDALKLNIKITGCLHAGTYDPNDFLYQCGMGSWGTHFENCLFSLVDQIYVATDYHKDLVLKGRSVNPDKIRVTGFPIKDISVKGIEKQNIVVFPHRLDSEKNPQIFNKVKEHFKNSGWSFVETALLNDKEKYLDVLNRAKISVSFADQETWGIAMQESTICGCIPIVPDKLSYSEMYQPEFKYETVFDAIDMITRFMDHTPTDRLSNQIRQILYKGKNAISNIKRCMYELVR